MARAPGVTLQAAWPQLSDDDKNAIFGQLAGFVRQLRSLPSPYGSAICSVIGGPFCDGRLHCYDVSGPFLDEDHMNLQLRLGAPIERFPFVAEAHTRRHPIVFTHGDLAPRNIMVLGTEIVAVLDWESSGWFPSHWEYCKAVFGDNTSEQWKRWIPMVVPVYEMEVKADLSLAFSAYGFPHTCAEPVLNYVPLASG